LNWPAGRAEAKRLQTIDASHKGVEKRTLKEKRREGSRVQNDGCPSGLFSLRIPEFESDQPGILNSPAVMLFGLPRRQRLPKSLPQLHIPPHRSSKRTISAALFGQIPESYGANSNGFCS
jgi:hypothetical protein